ncbi:MAG: hypothetical protein ACLFWL_10100 [Candidatus Brocadiia bacterium]
MKRHNREFRRSGWFLAICLLLAFLVVSAHGAGGEQGFSLALSRGDIDFDACRIYADGKGRKVRVRKMLQAMGIEKVTGDTEHWWRRWSAGKVGYTESQKGITHVFQYRIALKEPVEIGSILFPNQEVRILKADAPYPGDPEKKEHWRRVKVPPRQGRVKIAPLPPGTKTRAILLTDRVKRGRSSALPLRLYKQRLFNIADRARVRAKNEYHVPRSETVYRANNLAKGRGKWQNNGKNDDGLVTGPFISDVQPSWYILSWDKPREIAGVFVRDNFSKVVLEKFEGAEGISPLVGVDREWRRVKESQIARHDLYVRSDYGRWAIFSPPLKTRGFRFLIEKTWERSHHRRVESQIAWMNSLLILTDLEDREVPPPADEGPPPPPVSISYDVPVAGTVSMAIDNEEGTRVRNIVSRASREKGSHEEYWDLKSESGKFVEPGTYKWKGITGPKLELEYEMSVYPNVTVHHPDRTAWLNGRSGSGGWLADHSPPFGGDAGGDRVCFTCPVPEAGVGFIVCDLSGKKLWGIHGFAAWSGGRRIACNGKTTYVEQYRGGRDRIWAVDLESQNVKTIIDRGHSERRRRRITGLAVHGDRVFAAVNAHGAWIANATGADAVDITKCLPRYKEKREPRKKYEVVPDPRNDFLRLLRLKGTPPGYAPDHGLTWLSSTEGPGAQQYIMVAFKKPVNIGSCVYPVPQNKKYEIRLSLLKEDAPYPPDPENRDFWEPFETHGDLAWDIAQAPEQARTRALLIRFVKGGTDEFSKVLRDEGGEGKKKTGFFPSADDASDFGMEGEEEGGGVMGGGRSWKARLEGMQILRRRFKNLFGSCKVRVSSGHVEETGKWVAERSAPLTESNPAVYLMEWNKPVELRGLAIKEIDAKETRIDIWTGPETGEIPLMGQAQWKTVDTFVPRRRMEHVNFDGHNANALYMNGKVDFGETIRTRAVRLRAVSQWTTETREGSCAKGRLQLDPTRCRVFGVAPLQYVGGEVPVDPRTTQRIEVIDPRAKSDEKTIVKEIHIPHPGDMEVNHEGDLFTISEGQVVRVDLSGEGQHEDVITDLKNPRALGIDHEGRFYVFDTHPERKVIRVYDPRGKFLRSIGKAGGYQPGPWDPMRFNNLSAVSPAKDGKLWVVDSGYWPKRVACFTQEGEHIRDYLGPTQYGGGGVLDPYERTRLVYGPLEFEIDWETGKSRLKNLLWTRGGWPRGEIHIKYKGHDYFTNQPPGARGSMPVGMVYLYEKDHLKPAAAVGMADVFSPLEKPEIVEKAGRRILRNLEFIWADRDGNGQVDAPEVQFQPRNLSKLTRFNRDMGVQAGRWRYVVDKVLDNGVPIYKKVETPVPKGGQVFRFQDGTFYRMGGLSGGGGPEMGFRKDGALWWTYENEGAGVQSIRHCGPYTPGQVVGQFGLAGYAVAAGGDMGEFFVTRANRGSWFLWTTDGLLASRIFKSPYQKDDILWAMPENDRNMDLSDVSLKQEHFRGWFCRSLEDDKYYAVAGKPHASVVEVKGIDDFTRMGGTLKITAEDIAEAIKWERKAERAKAKNRNLRYYHCYKTDQKVRADGRLDEWEGYPRAHIGDNMSFVMSHKDGALNLAYEVRNMTDLVNKGNKWQTLFETGACLDLMIGTNPTAPPDRKAAVQGDKRILITHYKGDLVAVMYQPVSPGAPEKYAWSIESPVFKVSFDEVRRLEDAELGYRRYNKRESDQLSHFVLEAVIPLGRLGIEMKPNLRVKMDWGYLRSNKHGTDVMERIYWANQATSILADTPSEARLEPDMWGYVQFHDRVWGMGTGLNPRSMIEDEKEEEIDLDDLGL